MKKDRKVVFEKQAVVDEQAWSEASKAAPPSTDDAMRHPHEMMRREMVQQQPR